MALGLNIVVGFAGLLDLGYVAFYALGALLDRLVGVRLLPGGQRRARASTSASAASRRRCPASTSTSCSSSIGAILVCAVAGSDHRPADAAPARRLHRDRHARVRRDHRPRLRTTATTITIFGDYKLTNGRQSITPIDQIDLPFLGPVRLGAQPAAVLLAVLRAGARRAVRELPPARLAARPRLDRAARGRGGGGQMGVPLVKTKLLAYATGAAFGGIVGRVPRRLLHSVNANQFQFGFSIFILAMVILGGLGSIWGVVLGAVALALRQQLPDPGRARQGVRADKLDELGLDFHFTEVSFGIFGFMLVIMMVLRPEGLLPERRRKMELHRGHGRARASPSRAARDLRGAARELERRAAADRSRRPRRSAAWSPSSDVSFDVAPQLDRLDHRPERRRQDDLLQHAHRALQADRRAGSCSTART